LAAARGGGELGDEEAGEARRFRIGRGEDLEREGEEGVSGEDSGGLVVRAVASGAAPPEVAVVHGGEVIVDQAVAVEAFHGGGGGEGVGVGSEGLGHLAEEDGAEPLAAGLDAVAEGLVERGRGLLRLGQLAAEFGFHGLPAGVELGEKSGTIHGALLDKNLPQGKCFA
jgi:hypothetical protein